MNILDPSVRQIATDIFPAGGPTLIAVNALQTQAVQSSDAATFAKTFAKAVRKAWGDDEGAQITGARLMPKQAVTIASVPMQLRPAGTIIAPLPQANQIAVPLDATLAQFQLLIAPADKAAVGNTLRWSFEFSTDNGQTWVETNAAGWTSYGPDGYTNRDGVFDPDPSLDIPLTARHGNLIQMVLRTDQAMTIGLSVTVS